MTTPRIIAIKTSGARSRSSHDNPFSKESTVNNMPICPTHLDQPFVRGWVVDHALPTGLNGYQRMTLVLGDVSDLSHLATSRCRVVSIGR
jgi:hypothetical protein